MTEKLQELESLFIEHGCEDFKCVDPKHIVVSHWVRMKCAFGCPNYGCNSTCPPNLPSVAECRQFFDEYTLATIFHFPKTVDTREDRYAWTKKLNMNLLKLERAVFLTGYRKALIFLIDQCQICETCTGERATCKSPKLARPAIEGMAVDVFATVRQVGYPIEVLSDYAQEMNRYALLMIE